MDGFLSYSSIKEIQELLTAMGLEWEIASQDIILAQGDMPEVQVADIRVLDYTDVGVKGSLEFGFFDDKLVGVVFDIVDWKAYKPLLDHRFGEDVKVGSEFNASAHTLISVKKNYQGNVYVSWTDAGISDEVFERSLKQH